MARTAAAGRAAVALALALAWAAPGRAAPAEPALRVAVMPFDNGSGDAALDALGVGLQSMLTTDLSGLSGVALVERARLADVQKELKLQRSAAVDKKTAARIGKLTGATHLLAGTFVVHGDAMRLDARLFEVASGKVALAEKIEGERDAFFELEKSLAQRLVRALGLTLAPKERAELARIHTADFDAFRRYSEGVAAFDDERYEDALARLREAAAKDEGFALARVTLAEYEAIVARLRARADALQSAKEEVERLKSDKEASEQAEVLRRLLEAASDDRPAAWGTRLAALHTLVMAYGNLGRNKGKLMRLRQREDRFAMDRLAEVLAKRYYAEARERFPAVPLVISDDWYAGFPEVATFDADLAKAVDRLLRHGADHPANRRSYMLSDLRYTREPARLLHLDVREEVALHVSFFEAAKALGAEDWWLESERESLAKALRSALRLDESTGIWTAMAAAADNPWKVKSLTAEVERNQALATLLHDAEDEAAMREWLLLQDPNRVNLRGAEAFGRRRLAPAELARLARERDLPTDGYVLIGEHPAWVLQTPWPLVTDRRVDPRRAGALRWYSDGTREEPDTLLVLDGVVRDAVTIAFTLAFEPGEGYWPPRVQAKEARSLADVALARGRPTVDVLLAVRDVETDKQEDPETGERVVTRPMRGLGVSLGADGVSVARFRESRRGSFGRKEAFAREALGSWDRGVGQGARVPVSVRLAPGEVTVRVDGREKRFEVPDTGGGFYGLGFRGKGYVAVEDLRVEATRP